MAITADDYEVIIKIVDERVKEIKVTREDFNELKNVVSDLAKAQKRTEARLEELAKAQKRTEERVEELAIVLKKTEERLDRLESVVEELAIAQKKTEERVTRLEAVVEELAIAQKKTEERLSRLESVVEELAVAQKKTEERLTRLEAVVEELAIAQKRTEERVSRLESAVEELAMAQKRTEERIEELAMAQKRTEEALQNLTKQIGGLSETVGFGLEDIARIVLPGYLERHYKIQMDEFERKFFKIDKEEIEINLYAEGKWNGRTITILGESKSRIYAKEVERFENTVSKLSAHINGEIFKVMFGYVIHPSASILAEKYKIVLVASYQR